MSKPSYLIDLAQIFDKRGLHQAAELCDKLAEPEAERRQRLLDEHAAKEKIKQQAREEAQRKEKLQQLRRLKEFRGQTAKPKAKPMISAPKPDLVPGQLPSLRKEEKPQKNILDYEEVQQIKKSMHANFAFIKEKIRKSSYCLVVLSHKNIKIDDMIVSYIEGDAINELDGKMLDKGSAAVAFDKIRSKIGPNDAVLFCESTGGVKHVSPQKNMHIVKDFFNQKVRVEQDPKAALEQLMSKHKPAEEKEVKKPEGVGGVKLL